MKVLFEQENLICYYNEEEKVVFHKWLGKTKGEEFRNGLLQVYDEFVKLKNSMPVLHWLGDTRNLGVLPLADQKWLDEVWNEKLFEKAGVKSHAVIVSNDVFVKYAMQKFSQTMTRKYADRKVQCATFTSEEEAYVWFRQLSVETV